MRKREDPTEPYPLPKATSPEQVASERIVAKLFYFLFKQSYNADSSSVINALGWVKALIIVVSPFQVGLYFNLNVVTFNSI